MFVVSVCVVRNLCDEMIPRPEESYRPWSVVMRDLETSRMRWPWPTGVCCAKKKVTLSGLGDREFDDR